MGRHRKHFIHNTIDGVTFRAEEGLPLVSTRFMRLILESELAKAQQLDPVKVTALMIMGNHVHLHLLVINPQDVCDFVGYFKREAAQAINRLLTQDIARPFQPKKRGKRMICLATVKLPRIEYLGSFFGEERAAKKA